MNLFGFNYSKPGRGITPEEAKKRSYFGILSRKFTKISQASLEFSLCNILFLAALVLYILMAVLYGYKNEAQDIENYMLAVLGGKQLLPIYIFIPFVLMGPGTVGLTYITSNFSKQKHAFVWSDFWEYTKKYLGKGLMLSLIITALYYFYITAFVFYINSGINKLLVMILEINIGLFLTMVSFYVYPLMITFDIKIGSILKYACILAIGNYPKNLLVIIALLLVHGLMIFYALPLWVILMPVFLFGWSSYTINYVTWGAINKILLKNEE